MRRTKKFKVAEEGRDKGKVFWITEMASQAGFEWATRAFILLARSGVDVPEDVEDLGWAGLAVLGLRAVAGMQWYEAGPLMSDLMDCVQIMPDEQAPDVVRRIVPDDIEEIQTQFLLRKEVFSLHTDFFTKGKASTSGSSQTKGRAASRTT